MEAAFGKLELMAEGRHVRRALAESLHTVLAKRRASVTRFACEHIDVITPSDKTMSMASGDLQAWTAAVYFANSHYFSHFSGMQDIKIIAPVSIPTATHHYDADHELHVICISALYLQQNTNKPENILHVLDSETRHVVHNAIHAHTREPLEGAALRASRVIGEVVDNGKRMELGALKSDPRWGPEQPDPFISDFVFMQGIEVHGHSAARYLLRELSKDPQEARKQLHWLARLPIRRESEATRDAVNQFCTLTLARTCSQHMQFIEEIAWGASAYRFNNQPLFNYYAGEETRWPSVDFAAIRDGLIGIMPYHVSAKNAVRLNGRKLTTFASQLDYVALSLALVPADVLYRRAKDGIIEELRTA